MSDKIDITEILEMANELGLMLRDTDAYRRYKLLSDDLDSDESSRKQLDEYEKMSGEVVKKENSGHIINDDEKDMLKERYDLLIENELIAEYLDAKNHYAALLEEIRKSISPGLDESI